MNQRPDGYGGSIEGRNRFALEVARATVAAIGAHRIGVRLSPYGMLNGTGGFAEVEAQYLALTQELSGLGLLYLHLLDHSAMGAPPVPTDLKIRLRAAFEGVFILAVASTVPRPKERSAQVRQTSLRSRARSLPTRTWCTACGLTQHSIPST